jgi:hypothetical protein
LIENRVMKSIYFENADILQRRVYDKPITKSIARLAHQHQLRRRRLDCEDSAARFQEGRSVTTKDPLLALASSGNRKYSTDRIMRMTRCADWNKP